MKLFCHSCGEVHRFTLGEVERIVYALQGSHHDHTMQPLDEDIRKYHADYCLAGHLAASEDIEQYEEHVQANVDARLRLSKAGAV